MRAGKMTAIKRKKFNRRIYGELLLDVLPRPIQTEAENERALTIVDRLMSKGEDNLTPEETTLLELLAQLIERFEEKTYPIPEAPGYRVLQTLIKFKVAAKGWRCHVAAERRKAFCTRG